MNILDQCSATNELSRSGFNISEAVARAVQVRCSPGVCSNYLSPTILTSIQEFPPHMPDKIGLHFPRFFKH